MPGICPALLPLLMVWSLLSKLIMHLLINGWASVEIIAINSISVCGTVAACQGIYKSTSITKSANSLLHGQFDICWYNLRDNCIYSSCKARKRNNKCCQLMWLQKTAKYMGTPKLNIPPPSTGLWKNNKSGHTIRLHSGMLPLIQVHNPLIQENMAWKLIILIELCELWQCQHTHLIFTCLSS